MLFSKRLFIISSIVTYILLIALVAYFKYFPTLINSFITNVLLVFHIFFLVSLLVYGSIKIEKDTDICFVLPQLLLLSFIARAVPNLRLSYPPLHDPYYHYVCALNVMEYGTLKPILNKWYGGVDLQLHWPDLHLLTTTLVQITNINIMQMFRFQQPFMGVIFFLTVFLLGKVVTKKNNLAMISAILASLSDTIVFYQSEYHPQGLAFLYFGFILYIYIKSRVNKNVGYNILSLIFVFAFILSHHFSSIFLGLSGATYLLILMLISKIKIFKYITFDDIRQDFNLWVIIFVSSFFYHVLIYFSPMKEFIHALIESSPSMTLISISPEIPLYTTILNLAKWVTLFLAIISVILVVKTKEINELRLGAFLVCILVAGIVGTYIVFSPIDRFIGFYMIPATIFASLSIFRFKEEWSFMSKNKKELMIVLIAIIPIIAGFFNSQIPAYFFKNSEINTYYWYSNRLPKMDQYKLAGEWINNYTPIYSKYGVEFDTCTIPFFYGKRSNHNMIYNPKTYSVNYILVNPDIPYNYKGNRKMFFDKDLNITYTNGELKLYYIK